MATESLLPNGDNAGWASGGFADVDELVSSPDDGNFIQTAADGKGEVILFDLAPSAIVDGDTVTRIEVNVRGRFAAGGPGTIGIELLIGGAAQGSIADSNALTSSFANTLLMNLAQWNADWTAAQMDGAQIRVTARQSGMPVDTQYEVSALDVVVTFTPAAGGDVTLTADPGSLTLSGAVANFTTTLAAVAGSLALSGATADFSIAQALDAQPGSLVLSGGVAGFTTILDAQPGSLVLTGADADFSTGLTLDAQPGHLLLTGAEAEFIAPPPPLVARRGGRFIFDREPETREEQIAELVALVKPEVKTAKKPISGSPESLESIMGVKGRVSIPASKKSRVDRLLADTGISLKELIDIISM